MINLRFTFVKIIVIQPSGCKANFNKTIYLSSLSKKRKKGLSITEPHPLFSIELKILVPFDTDILKMVLSALSERQVGQPQAAQAPAVRWSSYAITVMAEL